MARDKTAQVVARTVSYLLGNQSPNAPFLRVILLLLVNTTKFLILALSVRMVVCFALGFFVDPSDELFLPISKNMTLEFNVSSIKSKQSILPRAYPSMVSIEVMPGWTTLRVNESETRIEASEERLLPIGRELDLGQVGTKLWVKIDNQSASSYELVRVRVEHEDQLKRLVGDHQGLLGFIVGSLFGIAFIIANFESLIFALFAVASEEESDTQGERAKARQKQE